jgi:hypothetical protein
MSKKTLIVSVVMIIFGLAGCQKGANYPTDPKKALTEYISKTFALSSEKDQQELLQYLTGEAQARLKEMSPAEFKAKLVDQKRQFVKLAFREVKPVSKSEVDITYELVYLDQAKGQDTRVTNKKLCALVLESGRWLIKDVTNIKELIEYKNEMSLP